MKIKKYLWLALTLQIMLFGVVSSVSAQRSTAGKTPPARPQGPCDIYAKGGDPCVAAHSTVRALYASYDGPLYRVLRQSDGKTLDIGVVHASASPRRDAGGYADAAAQDAFCANTYCWIATIYDQSPKHNDLTQAPRGAFSGPAMGGLNNLPLADMAPITILGHKAYGVFIAPGMGLRNNDVRGTAVDDQAEGQYWVINGQHYNNGCCFDYGNAETDSRDDGNGTMETTYFGDTTGWYHGPPPGPWVMTDQENNLVGCVNPDGSKNCRNLPLVTSRFVTAMAKGEPHHWTSLGGDAQHGALAVMFDGPRINSTYDPMRKQGAILLGNGGDNSNSSQGTFYEGAMTAAGTFPTNATDQLVQANVVAAGYGVQALSVAPSAATANPPGLQTFSPGSSADTTVTFTNTSGDAVENVMLTLSLPGKGWASILRGDGRDSAKAPRRVSPGASVSAIFRVTSGPNALNGDLTARATWTSEGSALEAMATEKVRNVSPIKINEFRVGTSTPVNATNSFVELFNADTRDVDISNWTLTQHATQQAIFSAVKVPAGTKLKGKGFYLFGLANSGLALPARTGDKVIHVRSTAGMSVGDTVAVDTGARGETRRIASLGTASGTNTTVWQPLPDGPVLTVLPGSKNIPVASVSGFTVGEKIALGYGATYPVVSNTIEQYEVATITAVGRPGTQAYLAVDAPVGATNIKVTSTTNISAGDTLRLDTESEGHGKERVSVTRVGTQANRTSLSVNVGAGARNVKVRSLRGLAVGDKILIGTPANLTTVTISAVGTQGAGGTGVDFTPSLGAGHTSGEDVVNPGTGLDLSSPLTVHHAANLPFNNRGTGISFTPATAFVHLSDEPVMSPGTGITLDQPLSQDHAMEAAVQDAAVTTAGYQDKAQPEQWIGGPVLSSRAGSMVLRDASGNVVDSLNYGGIVDPWAAQGYQANWEGRRNGCSTATPSASAGAGISTGRFPDGIDTGSNCTDFVTEAATALSSAANVGATTLKVASVTGFAVGQTIRIDAGDGLETAVITNVGTAGLGGSGMTLTSGLKYAHAASAAITGNVSTPGAPNLYSPKGREVTK